MAIDLRLYALPDTSKYIIDKARHRFDYGDLVQFIYDPKTYHDRLWRKWYDTKEEKEILEEIYQDSLFIVRHLPGKSNTDFMFYSASRTYDTLDYLVTAYFEIHSNLMQWKRYDLYGGEIISKENCQATQGIPIVFWDTVKVQAVCKAMTPIKFSDLSIYYNYEKMLKEGVYKPTHSANLLFTEKEFIEYKSFLQKVANINGLILIIQD